MDALEPKRLSRSAQNARKTDSAGSMMFSVHEGLVSTSLCYCRIVAVEGLDA